MRADSNEDKPLTGGYLENALTPIEQQLYLDFVQATQLVETSESFQRNIKLFVQPLFPHSMALACVGGIVNGKAILEMAIALNYPPELFKKVHEVVSVADRSLLASWYMDRSPKLIVVGKNDHLLSDMERSEMRNFNFDNFAAHGVVDVDGKRGSYFSLAGIPGALGPHHGFLLELMVPHLHQALVRILRHRDNEQAFSNAQLLTPKEQIVLRWLAEGKSNPEIAAQLNRSVSTVRNQVHSILGKLGAASRADAVRKSYELRLL